MKNFFLCGLFDHVCMRPRLYPHVCVHGMPAAVRSARADKSAMYGDVEQLRQENKQVRRVPYLQACRMPWTIVLARAINIVLIISLG